MKDKCRDARKKIENFLELDLHLRLCQLYRGKGSLLSDKLLNKPFISNLLQNNVIPPVSYDFKPPSFNFDFLIMHVLINQSFSRFRLKLKLITIDLSITSRYFYCYKNSDCLVCMFFFFRHLTRLPCMHIDNGFLIGLPLCSYSHPSFMYIIMHL